MLTLSKLGFPDSYLPNIQNLNLDEGPGRVIEVQKGLLLVVTHEGPLWCDIGGRLQHVTVSRRDLPAIGDFVIVKRGQGQGLITAVLPRRTMLARGASDLVGGEQIIAANIDLVMVVTSLNREFNLRRLERYLLLAWQSGSQPLLVLTKADLVEDLDQATASLAQISQGVPHVIVSAQDGRGRSELLGHLASGKTATLVGSSGVGKSTLVNFLCGEELQVTSAIRSEDDKGRHTTTSRSLKLLPNGALLIDTPGMRSLEVSGDDASLDHTFSDVASLMSRCKFGNCRHESEPQCAIKDALASGILAAERWTGYQKLQRELAYAERRTNVKLASEEKKRWKGIHKEQRQKRKFFD